MSSSLQQNFKNSSELISPIYVLSDLRQLQGHFSDTSFDKKYNFCKDRLGLDKNCSHFDVYQTLIEKLVGFFEFLIKCQWIASYQK